MGERTLLSFTLALSAGVLATAPACTELSDVQPGCGNRVREPDLGEDCDEGASVGSRRTEDADKPARCAQPDEPDACHWVADDGHDCPVGFRAGKTASHRRCLRPAGDLGTPSDAVPELLGSVPQTGDLDGDGNVDVMLRSTIGEFPFATPFYLEPFDAGYRASAAATEEFAAQLGDLTGDGIADVISRTGLGGVVVRVHHADRSEEPVLYPAMELDGTLRYLWIDEVYGGVALYADGRCGAPVCACQTSTLDGRCDDIVSLAEPTAWTPEDLTDTVFEYGPNAFALWVPGSRTVRVGQTAEDLRQSLVSIDFPDPLMGGLVLRDLDGDTNVDLAGVGCAADGMHATLFELRGPAEDWTDTSKPQKLAELETPDCTGKVLGGPALAFLDGEAFPDLVMTEFIDAIVLSRGRELPAQVTWFPISVWTRSQHAVGDVNGDGLDDVVTAVASETGTPLGLEVQLGASGIAARERLVSQLLPTHARVKDLAVFDLDGDGLDDIVAALGNGPMGVGACETEPDEIVIAWGKSFAFPDAPEHIGFASGVEQLMPGRELVASSAASVAWVASVGMVGVSSRCGEVSRGMVIRVGVDRRPFAPFYSGYFFDHASYYGGPGLSSELGASASLVTVGLDLTTVVPRGHIIPVGPETELDAEDRIEFDLPVAMDSTSTDFVAYAPALASNGQFLIVASSMLETGAVARLLAFRVTSEHLSPVMTDDRLVTGHSIGESGAMAPSGRRLDSHTIASLAGDNGRTHFAFTPVSPGAQLALVELDEDGKLGEPRFIDPPDGDGGFVGVTSFEGASFERRLVAATNRGVYWVDVDSATIEPAKSFGSPLTGEEITAVAAGDFSGDGLEDLLVVDGRGGRIVEQRAAPPANPAD